MDFFSPTYFSSDHSRVRWLEAVTPPQVSSNPEEKIYEEWDCPKVMGVANYQAQDSDELTFNAGDTAKVLRKLSDSGKSTCCLLSVQNYQNLTTQYFRSHFSKNYLDSCFLGLCILCAQSFAINSDCLF